MLEIAQRIESQLPRLKVEVAAPAQAGGREDEDGEDAEITFSAADLRRAFGGTWDEWDQIVKQEDPEVRAFLARRQEAEEKAAAAEGGSASKKKNLPIQRPPPPGPFAAAPKRKLSEGAAGKAASAPVPAPGKKHNAGAAKASPAADGKRQRRFWSREEELDLVKGVRKYGKGSWRKIMQDESLKFYERSATDLKDKWRNLEKKKDEYEKELDAMEDVEDDDNEVFGSRKNAAAKKNSGKREVEEEEEEVEDSDANHVVLAVKKEPATKKQTLSPSQIRESALEARNRRLRQLNNEQLNE